MIKIINRFEFISLLFQLDILRKLDKELILDIKQLIRDVVPSYLIDENTLFLLIQQVVS